MNSSTGALLSDLVDLADLVAEDENTDPQTLIARDHSFSQSSDSTGKNFVEDIRKWIKFRLSSAASGDGRRPLSNAPLVATSGEQLATGRSWLSTVLVILGLFLGWLSAAALLRYSDVQPINILWLILVYVIAQLALVAIFVVALIPASIARKLPMLGALTSFIEAVSPGRAGIALVRLLPQRHRQSLERLIGSSQRRAHLFGGVTRWIVLCWSQIFSLSFVLGAIACTLSLIVFTNLPFGWGTTLVSGGAEGLHRLTSVMAWPWASFVESAVPSLDLIKQTQHFQGNQPTAGVATTTGAVDHQSWWPFLVLSMLVYGLLPRVMSTVLANRRLKKEISQSMLNQPGVSTLLDRLQAKAIVTQAQTPEAPTHQLDHHDLSTADSTILAGKAIVINWSNVPVSDETLAHHVQMTLMTNVEKLTYAGGGHSIEQDNQLIASFQMDYADSLPTIVVVVKSWETPMLEFLDFLGDVRQAIGEHPAIVVLAVNAENNAITEAAAEHLSIWSERLQTIGDSQLKFGAPGSKSGSVSTNS